MNTPYLWEEGGGMTNRGEATIITGPSGEKLTPVEVRTRGPLSNDQHARFRAFPGCLVITVSRYRDEYYVSLTSVGEDHPAYRYTLDGWVGEIPPVTLHPAIEAACRKSSIYHCRVPVWAAGEDYDPYGAPWEGYVRFDRTLPHPDADTSLAPECVDVEEIDVAEIEVEEE
jgi:hypothetical protein